MATYTVDKIGYNNNEYILQDSGALQLTGGSVTGPVTFGDSVSADDVSIGTLSVTGGATFANNIQANKINNVTVGSSPKFTDTVTTVSTTGSGNAITAITASNGAITATKGSTFLTSAPVTSVNGQTGAVTLSIPTVPTNVSAFTNDAGYITSDSDKKLSTVSPSDNTTYSIIVGTDTSNATTKYHDRNGFTYLKSNGTTSSIGTAQLTLGNNVASGTSGNRQGKIQLYGSTTYAHIITGAPTANRTITLPDKTGTIALTSDIPTKVSDLTNDAGYTSNTGTVTGVKVNGTTINPSSGVVDIGTVAASDTQVTQTGIISNTSDENLSHNYRLVLSGSASDTTETNTVYKVDTLRFNPYQARLILAPSDTAAEPVLRMTNSNNYMNWLSSGSNWFCVNGTSTSSATAGIRLCQSGNSPYVEIFDGRSTATGNDTYRLFADGIKKVNNFAKAYQVSTTGSAVSLNNTNFNVMQSFKITETGTYLIAVTGMFPAIASSAVKIIRLTSNTSTDALSAACEATLPSTVTGNLNKASFTAIVNFTAGATYRIQMKTNSATNGSGYSAYGYVRLL